MRREAADHPVDARSCRISYWQGYVSGQYYAHEADGANAILSSPSFRTWRWRRGNEGAHTLPAASAALQELVRELDARGRPVVASDVERFWRMNPPKLLSEEALLGALARIGGDEGATAAELGREVLGDEARVVQQVPLRTGAKLRHLQLQGKVKRCENGGTAKWFLTEPVELDERDVSAN